MKGNMLVISGPSGSGKSSLMNEMIKRVDNIYFSISTTTRLKREGEIEGVNYHYISKDEFENDIEKGFFLEWAKVHDSYYGTSLKLISKALQNNKLVIFDIDVQGYKILKKKFGNDISSVFLTTQNRTELKFRLTKRGTDSKKTVEKRINNALVEMAKIEEYDYLLVNENFEKTLEKLISIAISSKCKVHSFDIKEFMGMWTS
ncbi:MAG: guanylate kinase [Sulfurospirillum sp.]|nr:guanylate kinase [Sulfurospirillum sp.]